MKNLIHTNLIILFALSTFIQADILHGQWKQFVYTDGLSSNYVFDIEKDDNDRIWIGTQNGITMIDGAIIKKYGALDGLPADNIIKVTSYNNKIYAATSNKGIYELEYDSFKKSNIVQGKAIYSLENLGARLFVSSNLENILSDGNDVSFMGKGFPNAKIKDVFIDGIKQWFVTKDKLIHKIGNGFVTSVIEFPNNKVEIQTVLVDGTNQYFGTNQGLWLRNEKGELELLNKNINVLSLAKHKPGSIIVGSKKGLYYYRDGRLKQYRPLGDAHLALNKTPIYDIKAISPNEVWYSTFGMGVYLHDPLTFNNIGLRDGLETGGMVYDMVANNEKVYIATGNGLFMYEAGMISDHYTRSNGLPSNRILDLDMDSNGILWLATTKGLSQFTGSGFKNYSRKDGLPSSLVTAVHVDNVDDSRIWTGSKSSGLTRFDSKGFFTFSVQDGLPSNHIKDITQLDNGDLAIACYKAGVATYNGKRFQLFDEGLDDKRVISLAIGPDRGIWAGTESAGIGVLEGTNFRMIRDTDGLGHNELFSLYYDGIRMWAGTFGGGVSSFFDGDWFTMHEADGLNSNLIGAIVALDTNKIIIGGNKGISIFTIDDKPFKLAIENIVTPKADIMLSDLLNNNLEGVKRDRFYINTNPMLYKPTESNIKYRKRVNKVGDKTSNWSPLQVSTQISFIPERVGEYNLEIQAVENRVSLSNIVTIPFVITRVWYLNPKTAIPFWGSIILLFGVSITNFINYRRKSKEAQDLREAEIARQQAEMEEAREFQQGMLPVEMPTTDDYEMVGFQQTATEVGGDFFDFMQKKDGKWVAICGDATGHGLTSGNVVSITKTAMNALVEEDPVSTLDSLNKTLLKMKIGLNRMCLNIANIQKDTIQFSSAGMPPAYFYSAENEEIEEILVGALPLGSFPAAVHMLQEIPFKNKGDILIMMSDGLPEAENINNEMVGYERTLEAIKSMASKSAAEIKNGLVNLCKDWLGNQAELKDDMTFVIIKKIK